MLYIVDRITLLPVLLRKEPMLQGPPQGFLLFLSYFLHYGCIATFHAGLLWADWFVHAGFMLNTPLSEFFHGGGFIE